VKFVEFIVVTSTVDIVQWYCVVVGVYLWLQQQSYSAMLVFCFAVY